MAPINDTPTELTFDLTGIYELTTESGSKYVVDLDAKTLRRETGIPDNENAASEVLRRDNESIILVGIGNATVGQPGRFLIDLGIEGVASTVRLTTIIRSITVGVPVRA